MCIRGISAKSCDGILWRMPQGESSGGSRRRILRTNRGTTSGGLRLAIIRTTRYCNPMDRNSSGGIL